MATNKLTKIITLASVAMLVSTSFAAAASAPAIAKSAVNVRTGPSTSFNKVDTLHRGENVSVLECQGGWCYVDHEGPDGWVSANYLEAPTTSGGSSSGSSSSSATSSGNADAAAAAAFAAVLGAVVIGVAASSASSSSPAAPALAHGPDTCKPGFVWRDTIPGDHVCVIPNSRAIAANENAIAGSRVNPAGAHGANSCLPGFVWREAYAGDVVCVTPARRTAVHNENLAGPGNRVLP